MNRNIRRWVRALRQSTAILGVAMIGLVWGGIGYQLSLDHRNAMDTAFQDSSNVARAFEEFVSRTINSEVSTLAMLRTMYANNPKNVVALDWPKIIGPVSDLIVQYSVIDKAGIMVISSTGSSQPIDLSDREHFKAHINSDDDTVFIGKPVVGRASNRPSIQLSRRVSTPDGAFGGVVVSSLDPNKISSFYDTIDIGKDGAISLVGTDKVLRAAKGFKAAAPNLLNQAGGVQSRLKSQERGTYITSGNVDGIVRVLSYRKVAELPLVVTVGLSLNEVLAPYYNNRTKYFTIGAGVTLLVLIVILASAASRFKLDRVYESLRKSETATREKQILLRTTLENIEQGILMADPAGHIKVINRRTIELLDLPEEWLTADLNLKDTLAYLWNRGEFQNSNFDSSTTNMLKGDGKHEGLSVYERIRPNGTVLEVRTLGLPDGGLVRTFRDITERKRAEAKIARIAHHDDLTGLANRMLFKERVKQAFSRAQRSGESFAVLYFDLDRFKTINDTMGHPAGDHVLMETARRLRLCTRDLDVVARLGGDEFAILQTGAKTEEEAASLAERTLKAIRGVYEVDGEELFIGASIGIAFAPRHGASYDQIMIHADKALYKVKNSGANGFAFCHTDIPFAPHAA